MTKRTAASFEGSELRREWFERDANFIVLPHIFHGRIEYDHSALGVVVNEPLSLKRNERLSHGRCAYFEVRRYLNLSKT